MSKSVKLENDIYLDSGSIVNNKENLTDILNSEILSFTSTNLAVTTSTEEITLISGTIKSAGTYLIVANIPTNYYGADGRELVVKLKINDKTVWYTANVLNSYAWTCNATLCHIAKVSINSSIKITISDVSGKSYAVPQFSMEMIRIK